MDGLEAGAKEAAGMRAVTGLPLGEAVGADEAYRKRMLLEGRDPLPFGVEPLRRSLEVVIDYALAQKLIPRRYAVDELFDPRTRDLT